MPIPDELIESIQEQDADELADALQNDAPDHYQRVYQRGFSTAHNEAKEKLNAKDAKLEALNSEVAEKEQAIKDAKEGAGDAGEEAQQRIAELEKSNQQLKAQAEEASTARAKAAKNYHAKGLKEQIVSKLVEKGVEPEYAREVKAPQLMRRIDVTQTGENGEAEYSARFMDADGVTPLQAQNGNLADVAAENVKSSIDAKWIKSNADSGGGAPTENGGTPGGYDPVKAGKEAAKKQKANDNSELAFS